MATKIMAKGEIQAWAEQTVPVRCEEGVRNSLGTVPMSCAPRCWDERDMKREGAAVGLPGEARALLMLPRCNV